MSSMEQVNAEGSRWRCESGVFDEEFDGHPGRVAMVRACHAEKAKHPGHPGPPKGLWNLRRILTNHDESQAQIMERDTQDFNTVEKQKAPLAPRSKNVQTIMNYTTL